MEHAYMFSVLFETVNIEIPLLEVESVNFTPMIFRLGNLHSYVITGFVILTLKQLHLIYLIL